MTTLLPNTTMGDGAAVPHRVWIVEDEPQASDLALDLCAAGGADGRVFRDPVEFINALRGELAPSAVVLDWRLERELSAALFMATRHHYPGLPVIYWTGTPTGSLPSMIHNDPDTQVVDKADGLVAFEAALAWALTMADEARSASEPAS
ncbi:MAG TPA: hypothetical protein VHK06_04250 [Candidatus Limnocylindria bacterium]|nr:hypothetical protein [Candidatus Limnocylindria bacterium]